MFLLRIMKILGTALIYGYLPFNLLRYSIEQTAILVSKISQQLSSLYTFYTGLKYNINFMGESS